MGLRDATAELAGAAVTVANAWKLAEREAQAAETIGERLAEAQRRRPELDRAPETRRPNPNG